MSRIDTCRPSMGIVSTRPKAPPNPSSARTTVAGAVGAAVAAEVAEVNGLVQIGGATVAAVLGVGGVLHLGQGLRVVFQAEVGHVAAPAAEIGHERVVGVEDEGRAPVQALHQPGPGVGEQLELAVAVELVAEEVRQEQQPRLDGLGHLRQPGLVDLEEPDLARLAARVEQRRGHSPGHVRPGAVSHHAAAVGLQARCDHRRGGRLAVGGRDEHRPGLELGGHGSQGVRGQAQQQPPRGGRAACAPKPAARGPDAPREKLGRTCHGAGTITLRQRAWTLMVAGVAPMGSPSA
jgi:hypothetical protein